MAPSYPFFADPLERTRYHEAGHAVVLWELFADVAAHVVATGAIDDSNQVGTMGMTMLPAIDFENFDVGVYRNVIATFYGGREAVADAVRRKRIENIVGRDPDEHSPGDRGCLRTPRTVAPSPHVDEDYVRKYGQEAEQKQFGMGLCPGIVISANRLMAQAQELAKRTLRLQWRTVDRVVRGLELNNTVMKLGLRDLLINRH